MNGYLSVKTAETESAAGVLDAEVSSCRGRISHLKDTCRLLTDHYEESEGTPALARLRSLMELEEAQKRTAESKLGALQDRCDHVGSHKTGRNDAAFCPKCRLVW